MGFNSFDYILFLSVVFVLFWRMPGRRTARNILLLVASYFFYFSWNGYFLIIILVSTAIDYFCGWAIHRNDHREGIRKLLLVVSLVSNLSILCFFKYYNFFVENLNQVFGFIHHARTLPKFSILLPVGISFYTFQSLSYTLDIYLRKIKPTNNFREFALFIAFFSQLIAGPIVRASEFLHQLAARPRMDKERLGQGLYLILRGLIKKMIIADYIARSVVDVVFQTPQIYTGTEIAFALLTFHFQVYCDFSGYTDIAIGSARLFGFTLPENFNSPYRAHSPGEFWRRWHMTLTRFAMDYLYIPLGGSRRGVFRAYLNIVITFAIIGFWHGANWNYVLFGLYHAVGVVFTRICSRVFGNIDTRPFRVPLVILTNIFIILSLPFFRAPDLAKTKFIYAKLLDFGKISLGFPVLAIVLLGVAVASHYLPDRAEERVRSWFARTPMPVQAAIILAISYCIYNVSILKASPFIYFQF